MSGVQSGDRVTYKGMPAVVRVVTVDGYALLRLDVDSGSGLLRVNASACVPAERAE